MRILSWYKFHLLRSFEFDRAWPWQKVYWTQMGDEDKAYHKEHGELIWPWKKTFWFAPNMKRFDPHGHHRLPCLLCRSDLAGRGVSFDLRIEFTARQNRGIIGHDCHLLRLAHHHGIGLTSGHK